MFIGLRIIDHQHCLKYKPMSFEKTSEIMYLRIG